MTIKSDDWQPRMPVIGGIAVRRQSTMTADRAKPRSSLRLRMLRLFRCAAPRASNLFRRRHAKAAPAPSWIVQEAGVRDQFRVRAMGVPHP